MKDAQQLKILMVQIDFESIKTIDDKIGSPFYLMFPNKYRHNLNSFLNAFRRRYPKVIAGYSFKTNYLPELCRIAKVEGAFAEVVSEMELELAIRLGFQNIIFNGPIKKKDSLLKAIKCHAVINLDSEYEIDTLCSIKLENPELPIRAGIRVNVQLCDEQGNSTIQCGLRHGRFGFPSSILGKSIQRLKSVGISICSLHGHTSSSDRAVLNYKVITNYMISVCEKFQLDDLEYFDIGGGFFGAAPEGLDLTNRPSYQDYANVVLDRVLKSDWFMAHRPNIVIEPGSSVVSNVFEYYTKVYQIKKIGGKNYVVVDGSVFDVKPTLHNGNLPHSFFSDNYNEEVIECDVVGSTCMEKDVLLHDVLLPRLSAGDYLQFRGVGAYTISLTPSFINFLAPIVSVVDSSFKLVRRRQNIEDILSIYSL